MKLLRIEASGLPLFKQKLILNFYAQQRVQEGDKEHLYRLAEGYNYYINPVNAMIGINASGKTSILKVVLLALNLLSNEPLNHMETRDILGNTEKAVFNLFFLADGTELCRLKTTITANARSKYIIQEEILWTKPFGSVKTKRDLTDFSGIEPAAVRDSHEAFLPDDTSMIIAYNKQHEQIVSVSSLLSMTDINVLPVSRDIPSDVIRFLDPTIEQLSFEESEKKTVIHLKFYDQEEITFYNAAELNRYLSSGTIKGIMAFTLARETLKTGGYLVIDELENHFNKEIVATLIRFFMDAKLNRNGGTLIFSTHYPEILDEFERNDCIIIVRNRNGITADNLSDLLKRNDIKKSDAYQSGFLEGTVPAYDAYMQLKKSIGSSISGRDADD